MNTSFTRNKGKSSAARRHFRAETMAAFLFCALFEPRDRYARMQLEALDGREKKRREENLFFPVLAFLFREFFRSISNAFIPFLLFSSSSFHLPPPPLFIFLSIFVHILFSSLNTFNSFYLIVIAKERNLFL